MVNISNFLSSVQQAPCPRNVRFGRDCSAKVTGHLRRSAAFFLCAHLSWLPRRSVERAWSQWRLWVSKACWENASRREEELRAKSAELQIFTQRGLQEVRMGTENLKVSFAPATQRLGCIEQCKSILVSYVGPCSCS